MPSYRELLKDPRWTARRLEIIWRAQMTCDECGYVGRHEGEMQVHHRAYRPGSPAPWQYEDSELRCLCDPCHEELTDQMYRVQAAIGRLSVMAIPKVIRFVNELASQEIMRRLPFDRDEAA